MVAKDKCEPIWIVPFEIEFSCSAAFWIVAASLVKDSELTIKNVGLNPTRTGILEVMEQMGGNIEIMNKTEITGEPVGDIKVRSTDLKPFHIDDLSLIHI